MSDHMLKQAPPIQTDVLIIGAGGAGARAVIEAAVSNPKANIMVLSQGPMGKTGLTIMANGGMHWVCHPDDSPETHMADVVKIGCFLNDQNLVEVLARNAPVRAEELISWGAKPYMDGDEILVTNPKSSGASYPRGHLVPGVTFMRALRNKVFLYKNIDLREDHLVVRLLIVDKHVVGALALNIRSGELVVINAKATVLASGGLGELFSITTNAPFGIHGHASGMGYALAYHAGARLIDMEMVQFSGHQLYPPWLLGNPQLLNTMCGGKYLNARGEEYMTMPQPRDMIQRLSYKEIREGRGTERGGVTIDLSVSPLSSNEIEQQLNIALGGKVAKNRWKLIKEMSIKDPDPKKWKVEFTPGGAHFFMGGVHINEKAETSIPGLFAAGEVTGGLHGANRMAGNALSEVLVFGAIAGQSAADYARTHQLQSPSEAEIEQVCHSINSLFKEKGKNAHQIRTEFGEILPRYMGVARSGQELEQALNEIRVISTNVLPHLRTPYLKGYNLGLAEAIEAPYMLDVAEMMIKSALARKESRGAHFREDFPDRENDWLKHTCVIKQDDKMVIGDKPVVITQVTPEVSK